MIEELRRLRQRVLERLNALEAMARQRPTSAGADEGIAARERALRQREAEVEEARLQLHAEAERQSKEWSDALARLDADRHLLAEAWERVERQRIEGLGSPGGQAPHYAHGQGQLRATPDAPVHTATLMPTPSAGTDLEPSNPVAQAILRQFEMLCRDVRSNADARRDT
jgi:hypothetical protein